MIKTVESIESWNGDMTKNKYFQKRELRRVI